MRSLKGLFILSSEAYSLIYGAQEREQIAGLVELVAPAQTRESIQEHPELLRAVDVIFSGWEAPLMDAAFLDAAPALEAVFYGAGATAPWITEHVWDRNIVVTSAYAANAVPVAEYALAMILFSLKHGWALAQKTRKQRIFPDRNGAPGCFGSTVGLVSLGITARTLAKMLRGFDLRVIAYDPFVSPAEAAEVGVELVSLDELFAQGDVISVHVPLLEETIGMITGRHLALMKRGATLINTARGEVLLEDEMIDVLMRRPDLQAVLDVAVQEPPDKESPLYTLANVVLTPHIAGSVGLECRRMGQCMVDELRRYLAGEPLQWTVTRELARWTSHRPITDIRLPQPQVLNPTVWNRSRSLRAAK